MSDTNNFAFNSLSSDDFIDTLRRNSTSNEVDDNSSSYEEYVSNTCTNSAQEFNYNLDSNDPVQNPSCFYLTQNQYKNNIMNATDESFLLLHMNIRSINRNFDNLRLLLENPKQKPCSIIGLTETWLSTDSSQSFSLPGFNLVVNSRQNRTGGGVGIHVSNIFEYTVHEQLNCMDDVVESPFVELTNPNGKNILIGVMYRPPKSNINNFITYLQSLLQNPIFSNKDSFLMGDFNIDLMKCDSLNTSQEFIEILMSASFLPLISKPTRVANETATLIDNIFCNILPVPESGIVLSDISDHYPIFARMLLNISTKNNNSNLKRRKITPENLSSLQRSLNEIDWSLVYNSQDVDLAFDYFMNTINFELDAHIPMRVIKNNYKKNPKLPWISKSILRSINRKNNLFYQFKINPTKQSKLKYTSYKNTLTTILRIQKKNYYTNQLNMYKHDIRNTWKTIKNAMNKPGHVSNISQVKWGDASSSDPAGMATIFNNFFSSIGKTLSQNIPLSNNHFSEFLDVRNPKTILLAPTYREEILKIVSNLKDKKSPGHDGIDNHLLKSIIPYVVNPLVHIVNLSLTSGIVPNKLKVAKVIPIYKKGDSCDVNNYRPISLLTTISKVLERIIHIRTVNFLKHNNIFSKFQFGFREKHSTIHALLTLVEKVTHALDKLSHMVGIFLDFSKAFDTINHEILLAKLSHYGIRGKALEWFRSYLSNRSQYVSVNGHSSETKSIDRGFCE